MNLKFLYAQGDNIAAVDAYADPDRWARPPDGICTSTTAKNLRTPHMISALSAQGIGYPPPPPVAPPPQLRDVLSALDDVKDKGMLDGEAHQAMANPNSKDSICIVKPIWALLRRHPPLQGQHFLSGLPLATQRQIPLAANKLLVEFSKAHNVNKVQTYVQ